MKHSTDIWFTAYLMHCGLTISKYDVIGKGKVRCYFNITEEEWSDFKLKFNNSEVIKFKGLLDQIKDLAY